MPSRLRSIVLGIVLQFREREESRLAKAQYEAEQMRATIATQQGEIAELNSKLVRAPIASVICLGWAGSVTRLRRVCLTDQSKAKLKYQQLSKDTGGAREKLRMLTEDRKRLQSVVASLSTVEVRCRVPCFCDLRCAFMFAGCLLLNSRSGGQDAARKGVEQYEAANEEYAPPARFGVVVVLRWCVADGLSLTAGSVSVCPWRLAGMGLCLGSCVSDGPITESDQAAPTLVDC